MTDILLGFQVPTGEPAYIENSHLICTGITNKSGKTTTLHALATRSKSKVLVFKTKPGEEEFGKEKTWMPFFKERADWQYVQELLEATMREKMKFERYWIITATKGTKSLREVDQNCVKLAANAKEGSLHQSIYTNLHAYFEIVLPELEKFTFSTVFPELQQGVNVMDLTEMSEEMQSLVIRSCLEHILTKEKGVVTIIPEVWKFAPEGRGNPVKRMLETLIKQGATKKNFVWIDSQDLAGVDKGPLKQVFNWILGLQTERNEVKHTIDQIPLPKKEKPTPDDVMTLKLGHFILANPNGVKKIYVQPVWMSEEDAWKVAKGESKVIPQTTLTTTSTKPEVEKKLEEVAGLLAEAKAENKQLTSRVGELQEKAGAMEREFTEKLDKLEGLVKSYESLEQALAGIVENVVDQKLGRQPVVGLNPTGTATLEQVQTTLELKHVERSVPYSDDTVKGRILSVMAKNPKRMRLGEIAKLIENRWGTPSNMQREIDRLVAEGVVAKVQEQGGRNLNYFLPEGTKVVEG